MSEAGRLAGVGMVSAFTLELFGLPVQPIVWGLIGGFLGAGWAKPAGKLSSVLVYLSASLTSALAGHAIASFEGWGPSVANGLAAGISIFFHPILAAIVQRVPAFFDVLLNALGRKGSS